MPKGAALAFADQGRTQHFIIKQLQEKGIEAKRECLSSTCRGVAAAQTLVKWTESKRSSLSITFCAFIDSPRTPVADGLFPAVTDMKYTGCVCVRSCILQRTLMHV